MTDREALYAAICAHPDEDTPRLAFADFLDEQGGKQNTFRAEFIRTEVALAREERWSKPWRALAEKSRKLNYRVFELARKNKLPWVAHLKGRALAWELDHGFIGHVTVYSKRFVAEAKKFFDDDPIRSVKFAKLTAKQGSVSPAELFACPHLARLAKLNLDGSGLTDRNLDRLAASPHLAALRSLSLGWENPFSKAAVPNLLKKLPALSELHVWWNERFEDAHALELAKCPQFARVSVLDLNNAALRGVGVVAVVSSEYATGLTELSVAPQLDYDAPDGYPRATRPTRAEGRLIAEAIAASKSLGKLRRLDLNGRAIGNDGLKTLAGSKALPALRELRLPGNAIGLDGAKALAESPLGRQLLFLDLEHNKALEEHEKALPKMFPNAHMELPIHRDD
jgi:uncharacterized protein (TIGR02996 family)